MCADSSASCPYLREERMKKGNLECGGSPPLSDAEEEKWKSLIKTWHTTRRYNVTHREERKVKRDLKKERRKALGTF